MRSSDILLCGSFCAHQGVRFAYQTQVDCDWSFVWFWSLDETQSSLVCCAPSSSVVLAEPVEAGHFRMAANGNDLGRRVSGLVTSFDPECRFIRGSDLSGTFR